jgi:hypothetical protein
LGFYAYEKELRITLAIGFSGDGILMAQHEKELAERFKFGLRHARCPKDGERVYEIKMPRVVCRKCGTQYDLAVRFGFMKQVHWKLAEVQQTPVIKVETPSIKEKEVIREVVMIPCKYCRGFMPQTSVFCPNCGARRTG